MAIRIGVALICFLVLLLAIVDAAPPSAAAKQEQREKSRQRAAAWRNDPYNREYAKFYSKERLAKNGKAINAARRGRYQNRTEQKIKEDAERRKQLRKKAMAKEDDEMRRIRLDKQKQANAKYNAKKRGKTLEGSNGVASAASSTASNSDYVMSEAPSEGEGGSSAVQMPAYIDFFELERVKNGLGHLDLNM
jgi:hypothetical protein